MKKVVFTAFAALAFAFTMTACGGETKTTDSVDSTAAPVENAQACEHKCAHEGDTAQCCKADTTKCCKAEGKECEQKCKEGKEGCKQQCKEGEKKECCNKAK